MSMMEKLFFITFLLPMVICDQAIGNFNTTNRIVGGSVVSAHNIPFQVGLTTSQGTSPFCGGSLISPNFVLTAAHCVIGQTASSIRVFVGEHNWQVRYVSKYTTASMFKTNQIHPDGLLELNLCLQKNMLSYVSIS